MESKIKKAALSFLRVMLSNRVTDTFALSLVIFIVFMAVNSIRHSFLPVHQPGNLVCPEGFVCAGDRGNLISAPIKHYRNGDWINSK